MTTKATRRNFLLASATGVGLLSSVPVLAQDDVDTPTVPPPKFAIVLFEGKDLSGWVSRKGGPAGWRVRGSYLEVVPGSGDIYTKRTFGDFQLHVEFWLPYMPEAKGQARANSGVYLQGRYEVQVLDSYGLDSKDNDCGGIYKVGAPLVNACKKPQTWQKYDVAFRAPRFDASGKLTENARVTVFQNSVMIHNNLELPRTTTPGDLDGEVSKPGPILLQDHGNLVRYRNIWIVPVK
jgi:hypothetical protein